jgi:hypothetical protein
VGIVDHHHQTIPIAPNIKDQPVVADKAGIAVDSSDIRSRGPCGTLGVTIPCLEGLLGIRMLFPKETERFEGDDRHAAIIQSSRIGNNEKLGRLDIMTSEGEADLRCAYQKPEPPQVDT